MKRLFLSAALAISVAVAFAAPPQTKQNPHPQIEKLMGRVLEAEGMERTKLLDDAITLSVRLKDRIGECTLYFLKGCDLIGTNQLKAGEANLIRSQAIARKERFILGEALANNMLGQLYLGVLQFPLAHRSFEANIRLLEGTNEVELYANAFNGAGFSLASQGENLPAIPLYRRGLALATTKDLAPLKCAIQNNLANSLSSTGERSEAIRLLTEALPFARLNTDSELLARTLNNFGLIYVTLGDYPKAMKWLEEALSVCRASKNVAVEAVAQCNIALVHSALGEPQKSIDSNRESIALFRKLGQVTMIPVLLNNTAMAQMLLRQFDESRKTMDEALKLQRQLKNRHGEAFVLMNIGSLDLIQEQPQIAQLRFSEALSLATLTGDATVTANTLALLGGSFAESNPDYAIALFKRCVNRLQTLRKDLNEQDETTRQSFKKNVESAYQMLADLLVRRGRLAEAQQVLDMLKENELYRFSRRAGKSGESTTLSAKEVEVDAAYAAIADKVGQLGSEYGELLAKERSGSATPAEQSRLASLETSLAAIRNRFTQFVRNAGTAYKAADPKQSVVEDVENTATLKKTLRILSEKTGQRTIAVYTLSAESRLHLIVITPELQDVVSLDIGEEDLRKLVFKFRLILQRPDLDPRPVGKELYDLLIAPIEAKFGSTSKHWLWSLDGALRYIPMGALWTGQRYAIEERSHTVITPAGQADLTADPDRWQVLAFGASQPASVEEPDVNVQFSALPSVPKELADIGKVLTISPFLDEGFTRESFFSNVRLGKYPVIHIATHFHFEAGRDESSFLLLGKGGGLKFSEISTKIDAGLFEGVELLTLSACQTAVSSQANGRDFEGLAALAQRAGVRSVLASLWPVSDGSTRALMGRFYAVRGDNPKKTKAESLREAQLAVLRGELKGQPDDVRSQPTTAPPEAVAAPTYPKELPEWSHPYYWAPFVLLGNPR